MGFLINLKKLGVSTTVLATSISLVACGGGGSDGYYDQGSSNSNTGGSNNGNENGSVTDNSTVAESLNIKLQDASGAVISKVQDNSVILVAVQVLNADKGGIANKDVRLSINDTDGLNVTAKSSRVTTGDDGIAIFEVKIPEISTASGKFNLTATVDGTKISTPSTVTVFKQSVIKSDYNLSLPNDIIMSLPDGEVKIPVTVTDKKGGAKANQSVSLILPTEMQGKFAVTEASTIQTNAQGVAEFTIKATAELTDTDVINLANTTAELNFKLVDENKAVKTGTRSVTFKNGLDVVDVLSFVLPETPIVPGQTALIKVAAKNSKGTLLTNREVTLDFADNSALYNVSIVNKTAMTNSQGYALFEVVTTAEHPIALSQNNIKLKATYKGETEKEFFDEIEVVTANNQASDLDAIQRLEIASSYKINATNDEVIIRVKAISNRGVGANKGNVTIKLNSEALSNAVELSGSNDNGATFNKNQTQAVNADGFVVFKIKTNNPSSTAIDTLVSSGITATFTTDNNISNSIKIEVEKNTQSNASISYIAFEPLDKPNFDLTKKQSIPVSVAVFDVDGGPLKGKKVKLALSQNLTPAQKQALSLNLTSNAIVETDESGIATFSFSYTPQTDVNKLTEQLNLLRAGIPLVATASNTDTDGNVTQNFSDNLTLNFKAATANDVIDLDHFNVTLSPTGPLLTPVGSSQTVNIDVDTVDTDGNLLDDQLVSIGINTAALNNGVKLQTGESSAKLTQNGKATFTFVVNPTNEAELENLVANGITIAILAKRKDGSTYTITKKVDITKPAIVYPNITSIFISPATPISVLGGEVTMTVEARDEHGNEIPYTPINLALSNIYTNSRVSLSDTSLTTNSEGKAEFKVKITEGIYDESLIKNGITVGIVGTNLNTGDRIQQVTNIPVAVPVNAVTLRLTSDLKNLEAGNTYQIKVGIKDEIGALKSGYPVDLELEQKALDTGIKISNERVLTVENGFVTVDLTIPETIPDDVKADLAANGFFISGTISNPKGERVTSRLTFDSVVEPENFNSLTIISTKNILSTDGDRTIVTVQLRDVNGTPIANQAVRLATNAAGTLVIGTPGTGNPTNTTEPQTVITDSRGFAYYSVEVGSNTGVDAELLVTSGIELTATHVDSKGKPVNQIYRITAYQPQKTSIVGLPPRATLQITSNRTLVDARNDWVNVTLTLLDDDNNPLENQYVELDILNNQLNGALIWGPSGLTTDASGQAVFRVRIDESKRNSAYTLDRFAEDDLHLRAKFAEDGYTPTIQDTLLNVVTSAVYDRPSITVAANPIGVASSDDGVYYIRNVSASVVNFDGKPIPNQNVTLSITPITYFKGQYIWDRSTNIDDGLQPTWIGPNNFYYGTNVYIKNGVFKDNKGTPDESDDTNAVPLRNSVWPCNVSTSNPTNVLVPNPLGGTMSVRVVSFLNQGGTATFKTDNEGKINFVVRYPKQYAQWVTAVLDAQVTVEGTTVQTTYGLGLPSVTTDYSTDGTWGSNLTSPYGINNENCN